MGKIKIYDIAKKYDLPSKEVLEIAQKLNIDVKSHLSGVEDEDAKKIEETLKSGNKGQKQEKKAEKKAEKPASNKGKQEAKKDEKAPVIIRREVIISEEEEKEKKKEKEKKQEKKNSVGFVERKQNKDYNIVYRNRPSKPMTVSELFGLGKPEPKKEEKEEKQEVKPENKIEKEPENKEVKTEAKPKVEENKKEEKREKTSNNNKDVKENRNNNQNRNYNKNNRNDNRFNNGNNKYNHNNRNNNDRFGKRPLDAKGIEKNIKNIMSQEVAEKEQTREYNRDKGIDKQKNNNRFDENNSNKKKNKSRRNNGNRDFDEGKLKSLKQTSKLSNMFDDDQEGSMLDYYDLTTERGRRGKKRKNQNNEERNKQKIFKLTEIEIPESITVKDFAAEIKKTTAEVIKKLLGYGIMATINQEIDFDTAYLIAQEFGITAKKKEVVTDEDILFDESEDKEEELVTRPPVIVVMGHVDHGKTSLLDTIRKTNVIEGEAGGITQAIGAYKVKVNDREITFLDTPGHEAFTAMRARGAQITDIAILVVAANDGVMPQTIEAINHAKSAGIPIIVAINKIDLPDANPDRVKQELMAYDLVPEEWGGDTIFVPISAKNGTNIDQLLEMVLLEADVLELKANPHKQAKGAVIEAKLDKARGAIATVLVQRGTLDVGDTIVVGSSIGRIRAMKDDKGKSVKSAGPSTPVEIMGLTEVPEKK